MREAVDFLEALHDNNNREWFNANKPFYKRAEAVFVEFVAKLIDGLGEFDASVRGLQAKDCVYRIYRDTRFSNDKTPYKTHFSAFVAPHGKKSGYGGYYVHIEPTEDGLIGYSMLAAGLVMPEPIVLRSIREEILDNGREIVDAVDNSNGFTVSVYGQLKRTPQGFPSGTEFDHLLRLKDACTEKRLSKDDILSDGFLTQVLDDFRSIKPYLDHINRAVQYAHEEMMR
ncbi:MAG: DUF2461 domain-containing protein [Alistipes sp.]|nr:DUF2461 domain-containing protein [Alistipes sp.]